MTNKEETWETQEVTNWLINDEECYEALSGEDAEAIEQFVVDDRLAPAGLYAAMQEPSRSKWSDVDWEAVAEALQEE